jgi:hypothetical protein
VGFEPTISSGERPQTHTLDGAATGTDYPVYKTVNFSWPDVRESEKQQSVMFFFFFFCTARWLLPPDVPQPVRLIVLTLL